MTRIAMLVCAAMVGPAYAQAPPQPNLLLEMSRPQQRSIPVEGSMRDDIQNQPAPPRADPLRDSFRLYVGVGDPRCFPGEEGFAPDRVGSGTRRRSR